MTSRSMAEVASRSDLVWLPMRRASSSSGVSSGPNSRPISLAHDSRAVLRPTSVAMPTRSST